MFLRRHELTNENVSYFLINQSKTKTFTGLFCIRIQKREETEIPAHFIHEIKTQGYDVIGVNVFPRKLMRFPRKKSLTVALYTTHAT